MYEALMEPDEASDSNNDLAPSLSTDEIEQLALQAGLTCTITRSLPAYPILVNKAVYDRDALLQCTDKYNIRVIKVPHSRELIEATTVKKMKMNRRLHDQIELFLRPFGYTYRQFILETQQINMKLSALEKQSGRNVAERDFTKIVPISKVMLLAFLTAMTTLPPLLIANHQIALLQDMGRTLEPSPHCDASLDCQKALTNIQWTQAKLALNLPLALSLFNFFLIPYSLMIKQRYLEKAKPRSLRYLITIPFLFVNVAISALYFSLIKHHESIQHYISETDECSNLPCDSPFDRAPAVDIFKSAPIAVTSGAYIGSIMAGSTLAFFAGRWLQRRFIPEDQETRPLLGRP